jgi:hypothetical protein
LIEMINNDENKINHSFFYFNIILKFFFHFLISINLLSIKFADTSKLKSSIFSSFI